MRVAYLINRYPATSHSFIRREIQAIERQGHPILRISVRGWNDDLPSNEDQGERRQTRYLLRGGLLSLGIAFARVLLTRPRQLLRAAALTWNISRVADRPLLVHLVYLLEACQVLLWLEAEDIEHLHAHFGTNSATVAMLAHSLGGPEWSFTAHGPEEFDRARLIGLAEKIRRARFVIAISSFNRSQLFRHVPFEFWTKIKEVRCGIEAAFHHGAPQQPRPSRRLLCIGRLCEQKGQPLLLEAAHKLTIRGVAFELVLAGDGEMRAEIERLIARYQLQTVVHVTGWISSDEVRAELLAARALVLPSFAEGLPVVIMEAMALRRPVISTFVAGIPELVVAGEHGWLVPAGDADALADAMQSCLDASDEILAELGERAHSRVTERHDIDNEASKLIVQFQEAIGRGIAE